MTQQLLRSFCLTTYGSNFEPFVNNFFFSKFRGNDREIRTHTHTWKIVCPQTERGRIIAQLLRPSRFYFFFFGNFSPPVRLIQRLRHNTTERGGGRWSPASSCWASCPPLLLCGPHRRRRVHRSRR